MTSKREDRSVPSPLSEFYAHTRSLGQRWRPAFFFGCLLLLTAVLLLSLPLSVGAKQTPSGERKAPPTHQTAMPGSFTDPAVAPGQPSPNIEGGPDSYGYTFSDTRDPGGPPYNYIEGTTRVADSAWTAIRTSETTSPLDDGVVTTTIPFAFNYYGTNYTSVHVSTNGNIHFGSPNDYWPQRSNQCLPSTSIYVPQGMVAPLWFDFVVPLVTSGTGGVYFGTQGVPPNQQFVVEWRDVYDYQSSATRASFEVVLSQNGDMTFQYRTLNGPGVYGSRAVVGIQSSDGSIGLPYSCYQDSLAEQRAIRYRLLQNAALSPRTAAKGGAPGARLTYTETLINRTGVNNSFTLTTTGNLWDATVSPQTTGTIPQGGSLPVTVSVQIPPGAPLGSMDALTLTASSSLPSPGAFTATAVLTSSVSTNGVDFTPPNPEKAGDFGSSVVYPLRLYNRTTISNSFQLGLVPGAWEATLTPSFTGGIPDGGFVPITVTVNVPAGATLGAQDVLTVTASAQQPEPGSYFGAQVITTTAGVWQLRADMPLPRNRGAAVHFGSGGAVYVLGGAYSNGDTDMPVELYDSRTNMWYSRSRLPVGVSNAGAAAIGDAIYVPGGTTPTQALNLLQVYYPTNDTAQVVTSDPLPAPRLGAGVTALNGKLYVIGGGDANQLPQNSVFEYDPARPAGSRWQTKAPMPTARLYLGAAAVDGSIYAVGGVDSAVTPVDLSTVEAYDPVADRWTVRASMQQARGGLAVVGVNSGDPGCGGRLYALGGGYSSFLNSAEFYEPSSNRWRPISGMQLGRRTLAATYSPATLSLLVLGGWNGNYLSEVESISCTGGANYCTVGFSDVPPDGPFYPFVRCLACRQILGGYSDGTYRPGAAVSRGQLSKIVSNAAGFSDTPAGQTYQDVPPAGTFYLWVERLSSRSIIGGYPCGGPGEPCVAPDNLPYFRPNANASRGQISKITANAAGINDVVPPAQQTFADVPPDSPFWLFIERLAARNVMGGYPCGGPGEPCDAQNRPYFRPNAETTRGQIAKITANTFFPQCGVEARP